MKPVVIIFGPPGSGKGTQAKMIADTFGLFYFGTGDLMRAEATSGSEIGQTFQEYWNKGEGVLIPDNIVEKFLNEKLNSLDFSAGAVFDGYPRTLMQAKNFIDVYQTKQLGQKPVVLNLNVSEKSLIYRAQTRKVCEGCKKVFQEADKNQITTCTVCGGKLISRQEDQPEIIKKRLQVYNQSTEPVLNFLEKNSSVIQIDGEPPVPAVFTAIERALK